MCDLELFSEIRSHLLFNAPSYISFPLGQARPERLGYYQRVDHNFLGFIVHIGGIVWIV